MWYIFTDVSEKHDASIYSVLNIDIYISSEMAVNFYQNAGCHIQYDNNVMITAMITSNLSTIPLLVVIFPHTFVWFCNGRPTI